MGSNMGSIPNISLLALCPDAPFDHDHHPSLDRWQQLSQLKRREKQKYSAETNKYYVLSNQLEIER